MSHDIIARVLCACGPSSVLPDLEVDAKRTFATAKGTGDAQLLTVCCQ